MKKSFLLVVVSLTLSIPTALALPKPGQVEGHAWIPRSLDYPEAGYVELYEWNAFLCEEGVSETRLCRVGAPPYSYIFHNGFFIFSAPPGVYNLLVHQPEWFVRPIVLNGIQIEPGHTVTAHAIPSCDYSMGFEGGHFPHWQGAGDPWAWGREFIQTFRARGTCITHASFKFVGTNTNSLRLTIHEVTGEDPEKWPQVGPEKPGLEVGPGGDKWCGWRSGELPTIPGREYAVRLRDANGSQTFAPFIHRTALGRGNEYGTAYMDGVKQDFSLHMLIQSDSDGLTLPMTRSVSGKPGGGDAMLGWAGWYGQTWKARGRSLAALEVFGGSGEDLDTFAAWITIRKGGPDGEPVGIRKKALAAWWGPGAGILGTVYSPGEVSLVPGETYIAVIEAASPPSNGFSLMGINNPLNAYPDGMAWKDREPLPDRDLEMTIVEYVDDPWIPPSRPALAEVENTLPDGRNLVQNGGFEEGTPAHDPEKAPAPWSFWSRRKTAFWYGNYGRDAGRALRTIGGSINGTEVDGGVVQRIAGLSADSSYTFSGWVLTTQKTDSHFFSGIGYDLTGQTDDPDASSVVWLPGGRFSHVFEPIVARGLKPEKDAISVWVRGRNDYKFRFFSADFDDLRLVEETGGK